MLTTLLLSLLIGALSGVVAALCGVGGGIIMVPAFVYLLGMGQREAVATSLGAIVLISLTGTAKNHLNTLVNWHVAIACSLAGALVAWFAADWLKQLSNDTLSRLFGILLLLVGARMLFLK